MTMIGLRARGGAPAGSSPREVAEIHYLAALIGAREKWRETFCEALRLFPPNNLANPLLPRWEKARRAANTVSDYVYSRTLTASEEWVVLAFTRQDKQGQPLPETVTIMLRKDDGEWRVDQAEY